MRGSVGRGAGGEAGWWAVALCSWAVRCERSRVEERQAGAWVTARVLV